MSWDHCQEMGSGHRHGCDSSPGGWATGGDEKRESPLCASRGEGGGCVLLAYLRAGCLAWPERLWVQRRRSGPRGSPLEACLLLTQSDSGRVTAPGARGSPSVLVAEGWGSVLPCPELSPQPTAPSHTQLPQTWGPSSQGDSGPVVNSSFMSLEGLPQN